MAFDIPVTPEEVIDALYQVIDPELGLNIVDLGLVYGVHVEPPTETDETRVIVDMTLTTPLCPLSDVIENQISSVLSDIFAGPVAVNWVWSPPWDLSKVTAAGHEQLVALGFQGLPHQPPESCDAEEIVQDVA